MYAFTWTASAATSCVSWKSHARCTAASAPDVGLNIITEASAWIHVVFGGCAFRPSAGNPDDGIYLLISREDLDHAGACLNIHPPWCGDAAAAHGGAAVSVRRGLGDQVGLISMRG